MEPTPEQQQRAREMIEQWDTADRSGGWGLMRIEKQKLTERIAAALAETGGAQGKCPMCHHEGLFSDDYTGLCTKPVRTALAANKLPADTHADDFEACNCKCAAAPQGDLIDREAAAMLAGCAFVQMREFGNATRAEVECYELACQEAAKVIRALPAAPTGVINWKKYAIDYEIEFSKFIHPDGGKVMNLGDCAIQIGAMIDRLEKKAPPGECTWTEQATCYWTTTCGHDFSDDDGISFKWCGYCGGKLVEQQAKWAPDDNGPDR